jgi:hypothetical protein
MANQDYLSLNTIELITRRQLASILKKGISSIDLIPEDDLPRVRLGKSVRYTLQSVHDYIRKHESFRGTDKC